VLSGPCWIASLVLEENLLGYGTGCFLLSFYGVKELKETQSTDHNQGQPPTHAFIYHRTTDE